MPGFVSVQDHALQRIERTHVQAAPVEEDLGVTFEGVMFASLSTGLQNGGPDGDGFALVDNKGGVIQFLSYEGTFVATNGPAEGMRSENVGVREPSDLVKGYSLRLIGTGCRHGGIFRCVFFFSVMFFVVGAKLGGRAFFDSRSCWL